MVRGLPAALVEAFSELPLGGNGAAVVALDRPAPAAWMQRLAGRLQQSETAFLLPLEQGWALRWFTPTQEVPLCGHATLAAVLALSHWQRLAPEESTSFLTRSGPLLVRVVRALMPPTATAHGEPPFAEIVLPTFPLYPGPPPRDLLRLLQERLQQAPLGFWQSTLGYQVVLLGPTAPLASMEGVSEALTGGARQGLVMMQAVSEGDQPAASVAGKRADYQLRFFAPGLGINEDPVTGSAHALVAPYWMAQLNRRRVVGWQCSDRPGGMVCEGGSSGMIRLTGAGHLLWEGTLWAEPEPFSGSSEAQEDWQQACCP